MSALFAEFDGLTLVELVGVFHGPPEDGPEYALGYYDEIAVRIAQAGPAGFAFLVRELAYAQAERRAAVLFGLSWDENGATPAPPDVFLDHLGHPHHTVVMQAIDSLWSIGARDARERVLELREHQSPYVRGAVLGYMAHLFPDEARPLLRRALGEADPIVRHCALDDLDNLGDLESLPFIRPLVDDPDQNVREAARWFIEETVPAVLADRDEAQPRDTTS
jgi:HEAT repeat protein